MKPAEFPYVIELQVNDCFAYKNLKIPIGKGEEKPFRHLILTGKNGSGKTTILKRMEAWMSYILRSRPSEEKLEELRSKARNYYSEKNGKKLSAEESALFSVIPIFDKELPRRGEIFIFATFEALRNTKIVQKVSTVKSNKRSFKSSNPKTFTRQLKQFLVNKKVNQAFELLEKRFETAHRVEEFFERLEQILRDVFDDHHLKLIFEQKEYEFYFQLRDGRKITLNQLADGFSAFLNILLELLLRLDMAKEERWDYDFDPPGVVLIDEPETHLHLELQEKVLPLLTGLFPNIQFIVATHAPTIISSIKNVAVYNLTTQKLAPSNIAGSSYSGLMINHFGLKNEFSSIADEIIREVQKLVDSKMKHETKIAALKKILEENEKYLTPSMLLAIETDILKIEESL